MNHNIINYPTIPTEIVVHLGSPTEAAKDISISFIDYIKNVASSEIYPTWPDSAIEANILAQISFALNRIYNEWYPSRGYSYDITSLPAYDQTFIEDREIFDSISKKVDQLFNNYIYREGQIQPLNAIYCDGRNTKCNGLSQWGSVDLAKQNKTPLDILKCYYGNDVRIFENAPTGELIGTYPGYPIELGNAGDKVRVIQRELNRISNNYPAIPKIPRINGVFGKYTEDAVKEFQKIFNLNPTGIVDYSTWYKIKYIYNAVKRVNDIYSEGIVEEEEFSMNNKKIKRKSTAFSSIQNVLTALNNIYNLKCDEYDIHINIPVGIPVDGPSAVIAIATAIYSAILNKPVNNKIAMTGEISLLGMVGVIGGVNAKILAAKSAGANKVIIPSGNWNENFLNYKGIKVIPVSNIKEVFNLSILNIEKSDINILSAKTNKK